MTHDERQELIRVIVQEALRRLGEAPTGEKRPFGRVVVALSAAVSQIAVEEVVELRDSGIVVLAVAKSARFASTRMAEDALSGLAPYRLASLPADAQAVVAPELGLTDAAKLASGILDDPVPDALWRGLVGRLPVYASPGDGFAASLPKSLARVASAQRLACERLGVRWVERSTLWRAVARQFDGDASDDATAPVGRRPLVTEAVVASLPESTTELLIEPLAIVTPLARDMARRRGVLLVRRSTPRGDP
jgi:hypothetical protein